MVAESKCQPNEENREFSSLVETLHIEIMVETLHIEINTINQARANREGRGSTPFGATKQAANILFGEATHEKEIRS